MTECLDEQLQAALQALDDAGYPTPDEITFLNEDETFYPSTFAELFEDMDALSSESKQGLLLYAQELSALTDRRLYDFSVGKGLALEIGAEAESHFTEIARNADGHIESADTIIALPSLRCPTMVNSLAHEMGHGLDTTHFPDSHGLREINLHSGNPLFALCYESDQLSHPRGLANAIDCALQKRNYTKEALIANGHDEENAKRRLNEERFAVLVELFASGQTLPPSPLLESYYHHLVELDLAIGSAYHPQDTVIQQRMALEKFLYQPVNCPQTETLHQLCRLACGAHTRKALEPRIAQASNAVEAALTRQMAQGNGVLAQGFGLPVNTAYAARIAVSGHGR